MKATLHDAELALLLAKSHEADLAWTSGTGWLEYPDGGNHWISIPDEVVLKSVSEDLRGLYKVWAVEHSSDVDFARKLPGLLTTGKAKAVLSLLTGHLHKLDSDFDAHPSLLNTASGVVNLETGILAPHDPSLLFTKVTAVEYKAGATHPLWTKALTAVPVDVLPWLQQRLGQSLYGKIAPKGLLIVFRGGGSNGKTTLLNGCSRALGDYSVLIPDKVLLGNANDHSTELTVLKGARFAMIEETAQARKLDVTRLKKLVETPTITARRMRQDSMTWDATHTIFLSSNFRPVVTETDHGTWRRLALVEFPFTFVESDFRERTQATDVLEAVLAWLIEGAVGISTSPLDIPSKVVSDTESWREETDLVMGFINTHIEFDSDSAALVSDLHEAFNAHVTAGSHAPWSDRNLVQQFGSHDSLRGHAVERKRTRRVDNIVRSIAKSGAPMPDQPWVWTGIRFKDDSDQLLYEQTVDWKRLIEISKSDSGAAA